MMYVIPSDGWKGGGAIATQQHFIDGLRSGNEFETSGEQYLHSVRAMFACFVEGANRLRYWRFGSR